MIDHRYLDNRHRRKIETTMLMFSTGQRQQGTPIGTTDFENDGLCFAILTVLDMAKQGYDLYRRPE